MIKKLIAKEFVVTESDLEPERNLEIGDRYAYFLDPETGKYYRPNNDFIVTATGDTDLADLFTCVEGD